MLSHENRPAMVQPTPPTADHLPSAAAPNRSSQHQHHHLFIVTGPAGCGKSTVGQFIAKTMNLPFVEGDEYHPRSNVEKMSRDIPLTDADRWDWLTRLREESLQRLSSSPGVVVTCSALKRKYRDVIRVAPYYFHDVLVHFIYLHAPESVLLARVQARHGHYMGAGMVHSQFDALEEPGEEETDVIAVDVSGSMDEVEATTLEKVQRAVQREQ